MINSAYEGRKERMEDIHWKKRLVEWEIEKNLSLSFLSDINGTQFVLILFATAFTFIVLLLGVIHWFHVWMYVAEEKRQNKLYFLLSLFPVNVSN